MSQLLTVSEVADRLRLSERTIRRRVALGHLDALRLGPGSAAPLRFDEEALERFVRPAESAGHDHRRGMS